MNTRGEDRTSRGLRERVAFGAVWAVPGVVGLESSGRGCWIVGEVGRCDLLPRSLPGAGDVDTLDVRGVWK